MASHRSPDAPADDQAFSEAFDEDKSPTDADQRRPDRDKADADAPVQPVDEALDGDTGERFGETVHEGEPMRRREVAADQARSDGIPAGPKPENRREPDDPDEAEDGETLDEDEKIDEAMEETFPASDPPPIRPGES
jgi:hypothetical protein